jgi:hypothetical protein
MSDIEFEYGEEGWPSGSDDGNMGDENDIEI